ncbi:hypothetical protein SK128_016838 [Halocaridina rubra]|uniref:Uncharacterized protein n=1 Tax=Halocaridina rubra TaxID=373956 RepID=A0AAN9A1X7_HALRR
MAENLLELIFPVGKTLDQLKELSSNQYSPVPSTLIIGQLEEMKTALLMQAAVSEGTTGGQVLFIAPSKLNHLPPSVHGMAQPSSQSMNNIRFLYACHTADLQGYLASVHLTPSRDLPTLIIIDNLQKYVKDDMLGEIASMMVTTHRLFSLAQEAAEYCHTALTKDNINSKLIITD